jgi:hypothetical protein
MPENVPEYFPDPECVPACPPALGDDAQSSPGLYCNNYYAGLHPEMDYSTYSIVFAGWNHLVQCSVLTCLLTTSLFSAIFVTIFFTFSFSLEY